MLIRAAGHGRPGVMGAVGLIMSAVNDALAPFGVVADRPPLSPDYFTRMVAHGVSAASRSSWHWKDAESALMQHASAFMRNKHELITTKNQLIAGRRVLLKQAFRIAMPIANRGVFELRSWRLHGQER